MGNLTVSFRCSEKGNMQLNYPKAFECSFSTLKKMFKLVFNPAYRCENEKAIAKTEEALLLAIEAARQAWGEASKSYVDDYMDPMRAVNPKDKKKIVARNKRLLAAVTRNKRKYEHLLQTQEIYNEIKEKYD